jgi:hypothetical protein
VTGFLIRFFSGSGSVPVFGVDRFGSCNIVTLLECQCFQNHFKDIQCKLGLMEKLRPTIIYGSEV